MYVCVCTCVWGGGIMSVYTWCIGACVFVLHNLVINCLLIPNDDSLTVLTRLHCGSKTDLMRLMGPYIHAHAHAHAHTY